MKRTPMKRTPWPRKSPPTVSRSRDSESNQPVALMERAQEAIKKIVKMPAKMARFADFSPTPRQKSEPHRNSALLAMAQDRPCLLQVPGKCVGGTSTTVACHSNLSIHGKAGARKADDEYSVWGCFGCHTWLDQSKDSRYSRTAFFIRAHADQVMFWRRIAADPTEKPRFRKAAQWALEMLNATPAFTNTAQAAMN